MVKANQAIPVITIDGPSGSGKGTISRLLATKLKFHWLDSGAIYRVFALGVMQYSVKHDQHTLVNFAKNLAVNFITQDAQDPDSQKIMLKNQDVTQKIREPDCSEMASKLSALPFVRTALLKRQRAFRQKPGLIADGRDMGTVVFPDADVKIFLTASPEARAKRRYHELQEKHINVSLEKVLSELIVRDTRDAQRAVAPLKPAQSAFIIDTTFLDIHEAFNAVYQKVGSFDFI